METQKSPSLRDGLIKARSLLAGGWSEPSSTTSSGAACAFNDEGVHRFCLADALVAAGLEWDAAVAALEAVALPSKVAFDKASAECLAMPPGSEPRASVQIVYALIKDRSVWIDLFDLARGLHQAGAARVLLGFFDRAIAQVNS